MTLQRQLHPDNTTPRGAWIWVFASDQSGRHARGCAKIAKVNFGARYGQSAGPAGSSYAIPVFERSGLRPMDEILSAILEFCAYAKARPNVRFFVARVVGEGIGAEEEGLIARAFSDAPANCSLPDAWSAYLEASGLKEVGA